MILGLKELQGILPQREREGKKVKEAWVLGLHCFYLARSLEPEPNDPDQVHLAQMLAGDHRAFIGGLIEYTRERHEHPRGGDGREKKFRRGLLGILSRDHEFTVDCDKLEELGSHARATGAILREAVGQSTAQIDAMIAYEEWRGRILSGGSDACRVFYRWFSGRSPWAARCLEGCPSGPEGAEAALHLTRWLATVDCLLLHPVVMEMRDEDSEALRKVLRLRLPGGHPSPTPEGRAFASWKYKLKQRRPSLWTALRASSQGETLRRRIDRWIIGTCQPHQINAIETIDEVLTATLPVVKEAPAKYGLGPDLDEAGWAEWRKRVFAVGNVLLDLTVLLDGIYLQMLESNLAPEDAQRLLCEQVEATISLGPIAGADLNEETNASQD